MSWRRGTKGPLSARFTAARVVAADVPTDGKLRHLPGEEVWLVGERRDSGERKFYFCNHPQTATLRDLARAIKARWACEQAHQQLKEELGLDHFEGRSWAGLHRHALLVLLAFTFLQTRRLYGHHASRGRGKSRPTLPSIRRAISQVLALPPRCPRCHAPLHPPCGPAG